MDQSVDFGKESSGKIPFLCALWKNNENVQPATISFHLQLLNYLLAQLIFLFKMSNKIYPGPLTAFDTFYTHGGGGSQREIIPLSFYSVLPHVVTGEILSGGGGGGCCSWQPAESRATKELRDTVTCPEKPCLFFLSKEAGSLPALLKKIFFFTF